MDAPNVKEQPSLFGARVRLMRERRRFTQYELAERAHTAPNTIWKLESGSCQSTSIEVAARLAKALLVTLDYLAGIYDEHAEPKGAEKPRKAPTVPKATRGRAKKAYG